MANDSKFVVMALFNIDRGLTVFTDIIGITSSQELAFKKLDHYDYKEVIKAGYDMDVTETIDDIYPQRWFGKKRDSGKMYYKERHAFKYHVEGADENGSAEVTFIIEEV